mgnify:CR=1 FL=1
MIDTEANWGKTVSLLQEIKRKGISNLIEYLEVSDYFMAPASTKYHGAYEGGLCEHSLNVTEMFSKRNKILEKPILEESVILCGLLHDACKIGFYTKVANKYKADLEHPAQNSHARLSLEVIERYIKLIPVERDIILYHMGLFGCYGKCIEYTPLDLHRAVAENPTVQIFASCDSEEAHRKIKEY